jgi:hypothetical protein
MTPPVKGSAGGVVMRYAKAYHAGLVAPDFSTLFHAPQSAHWVNGHAADFDRVTPWATSRDEPQA